MLRKIFTKIGVVIAISVVGSIDSDVTHTETTEFHFVENDNILIYKKSSFIMYFLNFSEILRKMFFNRKEYIQYRKKNFYLRPLNKI